MKGASSPMNSAARGSGDCFATLGIGPTGDVRAIKRAYAGILKTIDLAADPDRFARLRADYELALERAPRLAGTPPPPAVSIAPDANSAPLPAARPAQTSAPEGDGNAPSDPAPVAPRWHLGDTHPRDRLRNPPKPLADIDNSAGSRPSLPAAGMPPLLSPPRGSARHAPRFSQDDDGESDAIAALLNDFTPDRARLLDAGLLRYGWDRVGTDLRGFGRHESWLTRLLEERARWQAIAPRQRRKPEALLARVAAAPPENRVGDLYRWRLLTETLESFPLWTSFVAGSFRLDEWREMATRAALWKRIAVRSRQRPLLPLLLMWILMTFLSVSLSNTLSTEAMVPLMVFFGAVQLVLMMLMAAAFAGAVLRRIRPKPS